jgi:site-specific DNA-methyltransferase (adenine-specific)
MKKKRVAATPKIRLEDSTIFEGDVLHALDQIPDQSIQCVVTSPPYWGLRDYNINGQIGLEETLGQFVNRLVEVFSRVKRVLKDDGVLWLNIGDGYTSGNRRYRATVKKNPARAMSVRPDTPEGLKPKDLMGIPWKLAFALQADGWYLRMDVIWNKPNSTPESVKDRPTRAHEYVFMLTKSEKYLYDYEAMQEPTADGRMRNRRSVWNVNTKPTPYAHFATFPVELIEPCILACSRPGDYVLDPFFGSGTVGVVSKEQGREFVGVELNPEYVEIATKRLGLAGGKIVRLAG